MFIIKSKAGKYLFLSLFLFFSLNTLFSGGDPKNKDFKNEFLKVTPKLPLNIKDNLNLEFSQSEKKSSFLAVCLSVLLPGMGELYAGRFDFGQYSLATDAALWLGMAGINIYGNKVIEDGRTFARVHAGFNDINKDDDYYVNVANFMNIYDYNDKKLRDRNYLKIYDPNSNMSFSWDSDANRLKFRDMRVNGDEVLNYVKYVSIALIANRIFSGINAARFTNQYNNSLNQSTSFNMSVGVLGYGKNIDGLTLNLVKNF